MAGLQSNITNEVGMPERLREYVALVHQLSLSRDPTSMLDAYRSRSQFVVPTDRIVSLSRRDLPAGEVLVTRSTTWETQPNPWKQRDQLPLLRKGTLLKLIEGGRPLKVDDLQVDPADPSYEYLAGMRSLVAAPIFHEGEPLYMVLMMQREPHAFSLDDLCQILLTSNLIGRATSQILLAEKLQKAYAALDNEFRAVGDIQRQLLPKEFPSVAGLRFASYYAPSTRAGGDYYDIFKFDEDALGVLIADVSGHGASAAVVVAMMHALLQQPRSCRPELNAAPSKILAYLNGELSRSVLGGQFVTAFFGIIRRDPWRLHFASAGHNPPRWLHADRDEPEALFGDSGLPLGIVEDYEYSSSEVRLSPGDRLVLYTDGITETFAPSGEMFDTRGIDDALRCCAREPNTLIDRIIEAVNAHANGKPAEDDRTLLAIAVDE